MTLVLRVLVRKRQRGQILVLAALLMVILIAITGLAIDISAAYVADRWQRAVADAASLAGGQDLQIPGSRDFPGAAQQQAARGHAMDVLVRQLGANSTPSTAVGSPCLNPTGCPLPGTPYVVAVRTPSPSSVDCEPERCIQVTIRQPAFGLTFARIFGQQSWSVNTASVAGRIYEKQYGIVALRPPDYRGGTQNEKDIFITGGSKVVAANADVATNTNLVCSGSLSELILSSGFRVYHFDPYVAWTSGSGRCLNPRPGSQLTTPIADPGYAIPQRTGSTPTYATLADAIDPNPTNCLAEQAKVPDEYRELKSSPNKPINDPAQVTAVCVRPGIYHFTLDVKDPASGPPQAYLLEPGVYFFDYGVRVQSSLVGGYKPGAEGVALVFKEAFNPSGDPGQFITTNSTSLVALNFGNLYCPGAAGTTCTPLVPPDPGCSLSTNGRCWATPANGPQGFVQTPGSNPVLMTVLVAPDPTCTVGLVAPPGCQDNKNKTLSLNGGGNIFLAGVQYAPSDNAVLAGNSGQKAEIGAFWAWSIEFKGGSEFTLASALPDLTGVLRLDPACSPTVPTCNP
jgi:hypothetical protein